MYKPNQVVYSTNVSQNNYEQVTSASSKVFEKLIRFSTAYQTIPVCVVDQVSKKMIKFSSYYIFA